MSYSPKPPVSKTNPTRTGAQLVGLADLVAAAQALATERLTATLLPLLKAQAMPLHYVNAADDSQDETAYQWGQYQQQEARDKIDAALIGAFALLTFPGLELMSLRALMLEARSMGLAKAVQDLQRITEQARTLGAASSSPEHDEAFRLALQQVREAIETKRADTVQSIADDVLAQIKAGAAPAAVLASGLVKMGTGMGWVELLGATAIAGVAREAITVERAWSSRALGLRTGLLWSSALLPTTRTWHASRHGSTYSSQEVAQFYSERGNRNNCYCSVTIVPVDEKGEIIKTPTTEKVLARMKMQREAWGKK